MNIKQNIITTKATTEISLLGISFKYAFILLFDHFILLTCIFFLQHTLLFSFYSTRSHALAGVFKSFGLQNCLIIGKFIVTKVLYHE